MTTRKKTLTAKPPKRVDRRKTMSTRLSSELRAKLEAAAKKSRRSLAQEFEFRLEQSFIAPEARLQGFGSEDHLKLLRALSLAGDMVEMTTGKDIFADAETAEAGYRAMAGILDGAFSARPGGPLDTVTPTEGQEMIIKDPWSRNLGQNIRDAILEGMLPQIPGAEAAFEKKRKR